MFSKSLKGLIGSTNLAVDMDLWDFVRQVRVKNDHWVQASVKWDPGSRMFPFTEGLWNNILTIM